MPDLPPKQRKRNAVGDLKQLAQELGCDGKRQQDLPKDEFVAFHTELVSASSTPEHRRRLDSAWSSYFAGTDLHLPPLVPPLPTMAASAGPLAGSSNDGGGGGSRLRSTACLFTWNSGSFAEMAVEQLWSDFVGWLRSLAFIVCWTATLEKSLKSKDSGRLHLHAYVTRGAKGVLANSGPGAQTTTRQKSSAKRRFKATSPTPPDRNSTRPATGRNTQTRRHAGTHAQASH